MIIQKNYSQCLKIKRQKSTLQEDLADFITRWSLYIEYILKEQMFYKAYECYQWKERLDENER